MYWVKKIHSLYLVVYPDLGNITCVVHGDSKRVCIDLASVHLAYTVISAVTTVDAVNRVPPPVVAVYQPPKTEPLLAGSAGIFSGPTESPLVTVRICFAGLPSSALNVTMR